MSSTKQSQHKPRAADGSAALPPLVRKAGAWITIVLFLLGFAALTAFSGGSDDAASPQQLPSSAEAARAEEVVEGFPGGDRLPAFAVFHRDGGLTPQDQQAIGQSVERMTAGGAGAESTSPTIPLSEDTAQVALSLPAELDGLELSSSVKDLRADGKKDLPEGLQLQVTGPAGFAADTAAAFDGANFTLLGASALVVAVLLIITYRSPILFIVPLAVTALADRAAAMLTATLSAQTGWFDNDGSTAGITSVLVFGAGTNYALLLVSRYREELRTTQDHRVALARAWKASLPAIVSSNLTVVLALLTLLAASVPAFRSLGLSSAIGLLVALLCALVLLPAALAVCGRKLFWPKVPQVAEQSGEVSGVFHSVATTVARRPVAWLAGAVVVLGVLASGMTGVRFGLSTTEQFRTDSEAVAGLETIAQATTPGATAPLNVYVHSEQAEAAAEAVSQLDRVEIAGPPAQSTDGTWSRLTVIADPAPATPESYEAVTQIRDAVHGVDAQSLVGGQTASSLDNREATWRDTKLILPLILGVVFLVLVVVLRSLVAPLLLLAAASLSAAAALGLGAWVSTHVLNFPGLDVSAPLYSLLFLIALGIDYTVFLVLRAQEESQGSNAREGMVRAVGLTAGVITSAGVVLAAVFAVLGVLPLITLTQVGIIVGLGIIMDTFLVRTVVIPALFEIVGNAVWWPRSGNVSRETTAG